MPVQLSRLPRGSTVSAGPIKAERDAWLPERIPAPPQLHDLVLVDGAPLGYTHWLIIWVPSSALGRTDIVTLECVDPKSPLRTIRRRVFQLTKAED